MFGGTIARLLQHSFSRDAVLTTTYDQDYIVRGKAFQIQKRITLTALQTVYLVFDPRSSGANAIFTLPISVATNAGCVFLDTYLSETYTGGTLLPIGKQNPTSTINSGSVAYLGATPSGAITNPREYTIGSLSTNQNAGGGVIGQDAIKLADPDKIIVFKFINQENAVNTVSLGFTWYEL